MMKDIDKKYIMSTYNRYDALIVSGNGALCYDEKNNEYIDFTSGIGVNSLGFAYKPWAEAISNQALTMQHISNLYYTKPCAKLAEKLCNITGFSKAFFANSGAEANEGAIKLARKYSFDKYGKGRHKIISLVNSFHGRTITTLTATGQDVFHNYFFPFAEGFVHCKANDINDFKSNLDESVCAVIYECIQGEGGIVDVENEFLQEIYKIAQEKDILLIADEVQTGVGRTGKFLACEHTGVTPDIVTLAKGLGGGLPIGAVLCNEKTENVFSYSSHGTTFGGNPVVCAGALVCVDTISKPNFLQDVCKKADYIRQKLLEIKGVNFVCGKGLMIGIALLEKNSKDVLENCLKNGLLVLTAKEKIRLLPPLNITYDEIDRGLCILKKVIEGEI